MSSTVGRIEFTVVGVAVRRKADFFALITPKTHRFIDNIRARIPAFRYSSSAFGDSRENQGFIDI